MGAPRAPLLLFRFQYPPGCHLYRTAQHFTKQNGHHHHHPHLSRSVSKAPPKPDFHSGNTYTQPSEKLSQNVTGAERLAYNRTAAKATSHAQKQAVSPWMRDGSDRPPVDKVGNKSRVFAGGKLLTTPSRMLKLVIPLGKQGGAEKKGEDGEGEDEVEPLALLVHPQQPLSYLERLIQSELPPIEDGSGKERLPGVWFRAPDARDTDGDGKEDGVEADESEQTEGDGEKKKKKKKQKQKKTELRRKEEEVEKKQQERQEAEMEGSDVTVIDGKRVSTGKLKSKSKDTTDAANSASTPSKPEPTVEEVAVADKDNATAGFVRWSASTEIGDFIRDAARAHYFALDIESSPAPILVGVPSFKDRTYYLRMRLRQKSIEIARLADIKRECDSLAERAAKRVALAGGAVLVVYWFIVYLCTFRTELGWDVMEPVTYLVGLSTLIGGYAWFLIHNRQVSYRSAMNFTITRRQSQLYEAKGFDLARWEEIVDEGNKLRREIKMIADEYDVQWREKDDAKSDKVIEALENERKKKENARKEKDDDDDDDD